MMMRKATLVGWAVMATTVLACNVHGQTATTPGGGAQRGEEQIAPAREATPNETYGEALLARHEAAMGRALDPAYRAALKIRLASLPLNHLEAASSADAPVDLAALLRGGIVNVLGDRSADLLYTPVEPCRVFDTRTGGGPISAGAARNFLVTGSASLAFQGGSPTGCGIPLGPATAVLINFAAVNPSGTGNLRAWAVATPQPPAPLASVLNYGVVAGLSALANAIAVPICDPGATSCALDLRLQANASATDVVGDVVGYFSKYVPQAALRSGQTVFGSIGGQHYGSSSGEVATTASLPIPAPVALDSAHVEVLNYDGNAAECPGTPSNPSAASGFVCIYPWHMINAGNPQGYIWAALGGVKSGFQVAWYPSAAGMTSFFATWAYTAP